MILQLLEPILSRLPENNRFERIWKLAQVDFKKRYYNDKLGLLWALLYPLYRIAIYYIIFKVVLESTRMENYALFLFCGLIIWLAFTESSNRGMRTLRTKKYLIENIQFNKKDLYISHVLSVFLGLFFNFSMYLLMCLIMGISFSWNLLYLPIFLLNLYLFGYAASMFLSVISIYLRDINHIWDIITTFGFWTSGVMFRSEHVLAKFPFMLYVNPFIGLIQNTRKITMYAEQPDFTVMLINFVYALICFGIATVFFNKYSHKATELL